MMRGADPIRKHTPEAIFASYSRLTSTWEEAFPSLSNEIKALKACFGLIEETRSDLVGVAGNLCFPLGLASFSLNNTTPVMQLGAFMRNMGISALDDHLHIGENIHKLHTVGQRADNQDASDDDAGDDVEPEAVEDDRGRA